MQVVKRWPHAPQTQHRPMDGAAFCCRCHRSRHRPRRRWRRREGDRWCTDCERADFIFVILARLCRRSVGHTLRLGLSTTEAARAGVWSRICVRAYRSCRTGRLAVLDRRHAGGWGFRVLRDCPRMHVSARSLLDQPIAASNWCYWMAVPADPRNELHRFCIRDGLHEVSEVWRFEIRSSVFAVHHSECCWTGVGFCLTDGTCGTCMGASLPCLAAQVQASSPLISGRWAISCRLQPATPV